MPEQHEPSAFRTYADESDEPEGSPETRVSAAAEAERQLAGLFERVRAIRQAADVRLRHLSFDADVIDRVDPPERESVHAELRGIARAGMDEKQTLVRELVSACVDAEVSAVDARARRSVSPEEFLREVGERLRLGESRLSEARRAEARGAVERMGAALEAYRRSQGKDDAKQVRRAADALRALELVMDIAECERTLVPLVFSSLDARSLASALRDGMEHPRASVHALLSEADAIRSGTEPSGSDELALSRVSPPLRNGTRLLLSDGRIPATDRIAARRIAARVQNRYFLEAAEEAERFAETAGELRAELLDFARALREAESREEERFDRAFALQGEFYAGLAETYPELEGELARRRSLETVFRTGEIVGEPTPLFFGVQDSGAPHKVMVRLGDRVETAIVKFGFSERFTRSGVEAGQGHWREVAGACHALGLGVAAPAVVARRLDGYGSATLVELVEGSSCARIPDWFLDDDRQLHPSLGAMAIDEYLKVRTDGAPRNIVRTSDGRIIPIDHGSDLPSDLSEPISSAALFVMHHAEQSVSEDVRRRVSRWAESRQRHVFEEMLGLMPESMDQFKRSYDARLAALTESFSRGRAAFPAYAAEYRRDFGNAFMLELRDHVRLRSLADSFRRAPMPTSPPEATTFAA